MATYILFWNPDISSYTKERFLEDFASNDNVGNWSFHEHEEVKYDDMFYMVKCGGGKTGIVMRGLITSECYESDDWSSRNRKHIYYADIEPGITINPWSDAELLTPELLTEKIPDFNWYGGHSGRKLHEEQAKIIDDIWFEYIDSHPLMFFRKEASIDEYNGMLMPQRIQNKLFEGKDNYCEACGFSPDNVYGKNVRISDESIFRPIPLYSGVLKRLIYNLCSNCRCIDEEVIAKKLENKKI